MGRNIKQPTASTFDEYRKGGDGCIKWIEDHCHIPVYRPGEHVATWIPIRDLPINVNPDTGRSYAFMWEAQKSVLREALQMKRGRFIYKLIVLCWMRGEGKSFLVCLIQLWKFFCFPKQEIVLGANSKDQVQFVHFTIMRNIILNSPKLLAAIGRRNILEKEIRLKDSKGAVASFIKAISSFSGIVSNVTGYTFSEMFDMKNPKFFNQLDGSIRNIPNALGTIDSTVSAKDHVLYHLYKTFVEGKDKYLYFSYRFSDTGVYTDFWHPEQTQEQLDSYRNKSVMGSFEMYFKNKWDAASGKLFTDDWIEAIKYIGFVGPEGNIKTDQKQLLAMIGQRARTYKWLAAGNKGERKGHFEENVGALSKINAELVEISDYYTLESMSGPVWAPDAALDKLSVFYDTDWAILVGIDKGDPAKEELGGSKRTGARTILTAIAKGLPGSKTNPDYFSRSAAKYIYLLVYMASIDSHTTEGIKQELIHLNDAYDGIDKLCSERYGMWDITPWCNDEHIPFEIIYPSFSLQKEAFGELTIIIKEGRFKSPETGVKGYTGNDILQEELMKFNYIFETENRGKFGSPEKTLKHGVQDDSIYSLVWGIYGGRKLGIDSFRQRSGRVYFGESFRPKGLLGAYI